MGSSGYDYDDGSVSDRSGTGSGSSLSDSQLSSHIGEASPAAPATNDGVSAQAQADAAMIDAAYDKNK